MNGVAECIHTCTIDRPRTLVPAPRPRDEFLGESRCFSIVKFYLVGSEAGFSRFGLTAEFSFHPTSLPICTSQTFRQGVLLKIAVHYNKYADIDIITS